MPSSVLLAAVALLFVASVGVHGANPSICQGDLATVVKSTNNALTNAINNKSGSGVQGMFGSVSCVFFFFVAFSVGWADPVISWWVGGGSPTQSTEQCVLIVDADEMR